MRWISKFEDLQLDIVGIIAVLGEASVTRNAQVTSLSWWSSIPRLLPAPQALLEHERKYRLPTAPGIVAGAHSGNIKKEINFFTQLLHQRPLDDYEVELVEVTRNKQVKRASFGPNVYGPLFWASLLGCSMSIALVVLSVIYHDGFALLATIMLSAVSSAVGFGTRWDLVFTEPKIKEERENKMPRSDVIVYYPNGAIRVIRPAYEEIGRLYFQTEHARYKIDDTPYRTLALFSTIMLMAGVVSLANASNILQVSYAAAYVLLNAVYWAVSAVNPCSYHWRHAYKTQVLDIAPLPGPHDSALDHKGVVKTSLRQLRHEWHRFQKSWGLVAPAKIARTFADPDIGARTFTAALWTAIVLTGTSQWLNEATAIAPINEAWKSWIREADSNVEAIDLYEGRHQPHRSSRLPRRPTGTNWRFSRAQNDRDARDKRRIIIREKIRGWKYDERLTSILAAHADLTRKPYPDETDDTVEAVPEENSIAADTVATSTVIREHRDVSHLEQPAGRGVGTTSSTSFAGLETEEILRVSSDVEKGTLRRSAVELRAPIPPRLAIPWALDHTLLHSGLHNQRAQEKTQEGEDTRAHGAEMQVETIHVHVGARGVAHAPEDGLVEARQAAPPTIPHRNTKMTADDHDRDASQGHDPDARAPPSETAKSKSKSKSNSLTFTSLLTIPRVHARGITSLKFSPDMTLLATASADNTINIYSVPANPSPDTPFKHLRTLRAHLAGVNAIAWSPVGPHYTLASASDDKSILLWSPLSSDFPISPSPLIGHSNYVYSLAFSPKGNMLVSGSYDEAVFLWDVRAGRVMRKLPAHSDPVRGVDFLRDGTMVCSCSSDGLIRVWDAGTGQCLKTLVDEDRRQVTSVQFTPNGKYLVAWTLDGCVRLWRYSEGACVKTYQGHVNARYSLGGVVGGYRGTEQGMGAFLASGSEDGEVVVWDVTSKDVLWRGKGHRDAVLSLDWGRTKTGKGLLVSGGKDRDIRVWMLVEEEHQSAEGGDNDMDPNMGMEMDVDGERENVNVNGDRMDLDRGMVDN